LTPISKPTHVSRPQEVKVGWYYINRGQKKVRCFAITKYGNFIFISGAGTHNPTNYKGSENCYMAGPVQVLGYGITGEGPPEDTEAENDF
jgi:hypothetical protein